MRRNDVPPTTPLPPFTTMSKFMSQRPKSRPPTPPPFNQFEQEHDPDVKTLTLTPFSKLIMSRKPILRRITLTFFVLLAIFVLFNTFFDSNSPQTASIGKIATGPVRSSPVKIYMYDLPKRFTYGVIESYSKARGGDLKDLKYPGNQHSAEWYLFKDLNLEEGFRIGSHVTRVLDPEEADLFYVPFFSSLSLVANPIRPASEEKNNNNLEYSDEETQEALVEWLEKQFYWKRNNGWDHVFICQDPNALYKVVDRVKNAVLLVSDFGRLRRDQASLVKDVILPYSHRIRTFDGDVGVESRNSLLFFMGNRYRKEGGKVRDTLFQLLENEVDVIIKHGAQSRESRRAASLGMHTSKFCLHPAGDTPSACRLFDAIVSLCIPVIVSDYVELPFEDVIDYRKIAVFVDTNSAVEPGYLINLLRKVSKTRILGFQQELKKVKHYFEYENANGTVNEIWRQVSQKLPLIKLMINRDKRLVTRDLPEPDCSCLCSNRTGLHTTL